MNIYLAVFDRLYCSWLNIILCGREEAKQKEFARTVNQGFITQVHCKNTTSWVVPISTMQTRDNKKSQQIYYAKPYIERHSQWMVQQSICSGSVKQTNNYVHRIVTTISYIKVSNMYSAAYTLGHDFGIHTNYKGCRLLRTTVTWAPILKHQASSAPSSEHTADHPMASGKHHLPNQRQEQNRGRWLA